MPVTMISAASIVVQMVECLRSRLRKSPAGSNMANCQRIITNLERVHECHNFVALEIGSDPREIGSNLDESIRAVTR